MTKQKIIIGALASIFISLFFLNSIVLNIDKPFSSNYHDQYQVNFILKNNMDKILAGDFSEIPNLPIFYGFKNSLFFSNHFLPQSILALPIYLLTNKNIILTFNIYLLLTIMASFFSMYLFAFYLTKRIIPSLVASTIFVFNPFVSYSIPDSLELFTLQWMPLIFLYLEKSLDKKDSRSCFLFFLFLTLKLLSSYYYLVFMTVFLPIYAVVRFIQKKSKFQFILNKGTAIGMTLLLLVFIVDLLIYKNSTVYFSYVRDLTYMAGYYSMYIANWFFMPERNLLYGSLGEKALSAAPAFFSFTGIDGVSFFWGFTAIVLFIVSFRVFKNHPLKNIWKLFLVLLILSFILSLGPIVQITRYFGFFPGLYYIFNFLDPLFGPLRLPTRFAIKVFFFLSIIIALTVKEIISKYTIKKQILLGSLLIGLILIEYWVVPYQFTSISKENKRFYSFLKDQDSIKVIVDLPIGNRVENINDNPKDQSLRMEEVDSHYLFWQMWHGKKLLNGYSSYLPDVYKERARIITKSPTEEKLRLLRSCGVDAIVLHKDEFNIPGEYDKIKSNLISLKIPLMTSTDNLSLFNIR
jgi:hypothetical protein